MKYNQVRDAENTKTVIMIEIEDRELRALDLNPFTMKRITELMGGKTSECLEGLAIIARRLESLAKHVLAH